MATVFAGALLELELEPVLATEVVPDAETALDGELEPPPPQPASSRAGSTIRTSI
jgi:hypothetical protein